MVDSFHRKLSLETIGIDAQVQSNEVYDEVELDRVGRGCKLKVLWFLCRKIIGLLV